jgi:nucleoside 2-deoxyribosyltransferase
MINVYFAGPLFTMAEKQFNIALSRELTTTYRNYFTVFLPQNECFSVTDPKKIANICKAGIDRSDIVLAVADGSDCDSGTAWEIGYSYEKKPIILLRTDFRKNLDSGSFNLMLSSFANSIVEYQGDSIEELGRTLYSSIERTFSDFYEVSPRSE